VTEDNKNSAEPRKNAPYARLSFLDGIRGWGSFLVLLFHFIVCFLDLLAPELNFNPYTDFSNKNYWHIGYGIFFRFFTDGRLAVLVFFVLSGYALSVSHFNLQKKTLALAAASRYFRLMIPILFTTLFAYGLLKAGLFFNLEAAATSEKYSLWLGSFYKFDPNLKRVLVFSLYDVFFRYQTETTYNSSLWTMSIELVGSFLIYGFLALFRRSDAVQWKIVMLIAVALFEAAPLYACFVLGYVIAELNRTFEPRRQSILLEIFLLIVFLSVSVISTSSQFRGDDRVTCLIATSLVTSASFSSRLRAIFSSKLSTFLGRISFPLYLIQIPVICSWSSYLLIKLPLLGVSSRVATGTNLLTTVLVCLVLSVLFLPIEKFSIYASRRIGRLLLTYTETSSSPL
jgi:peptidoglycan/LPS O-acetylase OafA/YrhL